MGATSGRHPESNARDIPFSRLPRGEWVGGAEGEGKEKATISRGRDKGRKEDEDLGRGVGVGGGEARCHFTAVISVTTEITYFFHPWVQITLLFSKVITEK